MNIKTVTVGRTYNLGNYESLRVELSADIKEGEDINSVQESLTNTLDSMYNIHVAERAFPKRVR